MNQVLETETSPWGRRGRRLLPALEYGKKEKSAPLSYLVTRFPEVTLGLEVDA
jgi:hypothetical protein